MTLYEKIVAGEEKIALVGLGYVGMPIAVAFAKQVKVIGFDLNAKKIDLYKQGIDPTHEVGDEGVKASTVEFTADETKLKEAKFHIVAVPTPVNTDHTPDLTPVEGASTILGRNLTKGSIVVFESTVYPGVTGDVCVPILEKESGLKCGTDFKIGYSPERINPGDKVHRLETIRKVVSGMDAETCDTIANVYNLVIKAGTFKVSSIKTAEAVKVVENSQRDVNIAFMNELAMVFDRMGIDTAEVIDGMNTKWNALGFRPGLVGGHCIGVDPYYFTYEAEKLGYHSQIILNGRIVNDGMGAFIAESTMPSFLRSSVPFRILTKWKNIIQLYVQDGKCVKDKLLATIQFHPAVFNRQYDVIISTFSPLGTIMAGDVLREQYRAKWIIDFRDVMNRTLYSPIIKTLLSRTQRKYARRADLCLCVSEGNRRLLEKSAGSDIPIYVISNGYEKIDLEKTKHIANRELTLCYTGSWYEGKQDLSLLYNALREAGVSQYRLVYAGKQFDALLRNAKGCGAQEHLENLGYLTREETMEVQLRSDAFIVASWNNAKEEGVLTGKFYEALRCRKPVVAIVSGERKKSELRELVERYHLGICCEEGDLETQRNLVRYICKQSKRYLTNGVLDYKPDREVFRIFDYEVIVKKLEQVITMIVAEEDSRNE